MNKKDEEEINKNKLKEENSKDEENSLKYFSFQNFYVFEISLIYFLCVFQIRIFMFCVSKFKF